MALTNSDLIHTAALFGEIEMLSRTMRHKLEDRARKAATTHELQVTTQTTADHLQQMMGCIEVVRAKILR